MAVANARGKLHRKRFPARKVCSHNQENYFPDDLDDSFHTGLLHGNSFRGSSKRNFRSKWGIVGNRKLKGDGSTVSGWGGADKTRQQFKGNTDVHKQRGKKQRKDLTKLCLMTKGKRKLYPEDIAKLSHREDINKLSHHEDIDKLSHREDIDKLSHAKHRENNDKHENDGDYERYDFIPRCNNQDFEENGNYYDVGTISHLDHLVPTLHHCYDDDDINYNVQSIYQSENVFTHKESDQWHAKEEQGGSINRDIAQVTSCKSKLEMETLTMELTKEWDDCNNEYVASPSLSTKNLIATCEMHIMKEECDESLGAIEDKDKRLNDYFVPNADAFPDDEIELPIWKDEISGKQQKADVPPCQPKRSCFEL